MTKERELLRRALDCIVGNMTAEDLHFEQRLAKEIIAHLAAEEGKQEEEPVAWQWLHSGHFRKKIPANANKLEWYPLFLHPSPQAEQRKPLSEEEIDSLFNCDETSPEYEHGFRDGIWFAEKHHGIGGGDE